jgi:hypothetical protein
MAASENCGCPVANFNRPAKCTDPNDDDLTRSLMEEFLSSTRKPIGASDLFKVKNTADLPNAHEHSFDSDRYDSKKDLAWMLVLYLLGVIGSMIVAGLWFF